jgi:putative transposase
MVLDLFFRKGVGLAAYPAIRRELALDAILMAVRKRSPRDTVLQSDQGSQQSSDDWRRFCRTNNLEPSMSHTRQMLRQRSRGVFFQ